MNICDLLQQLTPGWVAFQKVFEGLCIGVER